MTYSLYWSCISLYVWLHHLSSYLGKNRFKFIDNFLYKFICNLNYSLFLQGFRDNANVGTTTQWPSGQTISATWDVNAMYAWGQVCTYVRVHLVHGYILIDRCNISTALRYRCFSGFVIQLQNSNNNFPCHRSRLIRCYVHQRLLMYVCREWARSLLAKGPTFSSVLLLLPYFSDICSVLCIVLFESFITGLIMCHLLLLHLWCDLWC